jgi:Methyltransferase domain
VNAPAAAEANAMRAPARGRRRKLWFGLLTVLGLAERGFFIPHRYARTVPRAGRRAPYSAIESLMRAREPAFREALGWLDDYADDLFRIGEDSGPRWTQSWFPRLDAAIAYALVRRMAPRQVIEVGAGHSTRFLARAVADGGLATRIVAIDPAPRASLAGLPVDWRRTTVQEAGPGVFAALAPGDILSIDSSHILMPGSDVDTLLGRVLPALPAGVTVHIHDIFLPDDYPAEWDWRGYNEQLGALGLLLGGGWEIVFASHYVATRMADAVAGSAAGRLALPADAFESSLWLRARPVHGAE